MADADDINTLSSLLNEESFFYQLLQEDNLDSADKLNYYICIVGLFLAPILAICIIISLFLVLKFTSSHKNLKFIGLVFVILNVLEDIVIFIQSLNFTVLTFNVHLSLFLEMFKFATAYSIGQLFVLLFIERCISIVKARSYSNSPFSWWYVVGLIINLVISYVMTLNHMMLLFPQVIHTISIGILSVMAFIIYNYLMWEERKHLSVESQNKTNLNYRYQLISNRKLFYIVQLFMSGLSCTTLGGSLLLLATQYKLFSFRFSSNLFDLCYAAGMLCVPGVVTFCLRNSIKVRVLHKSNITRIQELTVTTEVKRKNIHAGDEYFKRLKNSWANP